MAMTQEIPIAELGERLLSAHESGRAIAPLTREYPTMSVEDAYRVQRHLIDRWTSAGRSVFGFKVGLTADAIRTQLGVDAPDFGHLVEGMRLDHSTPIALDSFISPRIEPELAFVLRSPLRGPGVSVEDAANAVGHAVAALEIIDSRIADWKIQLVDTVADNASCGGVIVGEHPFPITERDLAAIHVDLLQNGTVKQSGLGAAVDGSPLRSLAWLANTLGVLGEELPAGSVVMSGSMTAAIPIEAGDIVTAVFDGIETLSVSFRERQPGTSRRNLP